MIENLEDAVLVLADAIEIREQFISEPDPETESVTEDSIYAALAIAGASPFEILELKDRYTSFLRKIIRPSVDPKRLNR